MSRLAAIILIVGGLTVFLQVYVEGVDHAFGGALARVTQMWKDHGAKAAWPAEPTPRRTVSEGVEREGGRTLQPIGQRVRERVNRAMDEGSRRYGGERE